MSKAMRFVVAAAIASCVFVFAACGGGDSSTGGGTEASGGDTSGGGDVAAVKFDSVEAGLPESVPKPANCSGKTIGWLAPLNSNENISILSEALDAYASEVGADLILEDGEGDPDTQVSQFEQLLARQTDAILVFPLDANALRPLLKRAEGSGVPVIGAEVNLEDASRQPGYLAQVWQRRDELMYLQAKQMAEELGPGAKVGVIGSAIPVPSLKYAAERAEYWAEKFGLEVVARSDNTTDDISGGSTAMTEVLSKAPDVEGVLAYNEDSAVGAAATARSSGKSDIVLMGINGGSIGFDAVEDGRIDATVQIRTPSLGERMVYAACDAIEGKKIPPTILADEPRVVTAETIDEVPRNEEDLEAIGG